MDCCKIYRVDTGCRVLFADSASQLVRVRNVFRFGGCNDAPTWSTLPFVHSEMKLRTVKDFYVLSTFLWSRCYTLLQWDTAHIVSKNVRLAACIAYQSVDKIDGQPMIILESLDDRPQFPLTRHDVRIVLLQWILEDILPASSTSTGVKSCISKIILQTNSDDPGIVSQLIFKLIWLS